MSEQKEEVVSIAKEWQSAIEMKQAPEARAKILARLYDAVIALRAAELSGAAGSPPAPSQ